MNNNRFLLIELFDVYKDLLTQKQAIYFEDYYINDQSLSELANHYSVSRSAVLDSINKTEKILLEYEEKLELLKQKKQILHWLDNNEQNISDKIIKLKLFR